ncbi:dipeptidase [Roseivirga sp.]|uniref:dipeptidase n=1 Tax=Roseivirga sp. TaxID=1964215 RepID=UPI003B8BF893
MKKLSYFLGITLFLFTSCQPQEKSVNDMTEEEVVDYARGIHDRVITLDTHDDINTNNFTEDNNYTKKLPTQVNLPNMIEGGLDVAWFIVYTGQRELTDEGFNNAYANADDKFKAIHRLAEEIAPDKIEIALTSDDVRRIAATGKKVAMIGIENGYPVGMDISRVKEFHDRGARYMSLAHNGHSQLSDSNTGERDSVWLHNGLSDLGREVIKEMNKWGIMIDLSHPSKVANMQMMEMSKAPVIASHSSARALNKSVSRNLDDEQLMMLKENGGVVQTVAFKSYLNTEKHNANRTKSSEVIAQIAKEEGFEIKPAALYRAMSRNERTAYFDSYEAFQEKHKDRIDSLINSVAPPVDVADYVDHIDYLVKKIGIEHVGISSDFDGGGGVEGWNDASETFNVTLELVKRGYSEKEIGMIWSGNLLRVLDEVQAVAKEIQAAD